MATDKKNNTSTDNKKIADLQVIIAKDINEIYDRLPKILEQLATARKLFANPKF